MRELCPRSYDVVERAELHSLRLDLFDDATRENPVTVTVRQDPDVGIPGVVYDCAVHLAAFVVDEVISRNDEREERFAFPGDAEDEGGPVRVLELGAGTGACGCLLAAALARRNVEIHLTLTDRQPAAVALCAANLAANPPETRMRENETTRATRRYAFGDPIDDLLRPDEIGDSRVVSVEAREDHGGGRDGDDGDDDDVVVDDDAREARAARGVDDATRSATRSAALRNRRRRRDRSSETTSETSPRFDVVLASDVLYDEASAGALAATLRDLLQPRSPRATRTERARAPRARPAACFLAWRPRAASPNKASAARAFLAECASNRLRVCDATREGKKTAEAFVRASDAANRRGWTQSLTARDAAERGTRVLRIEAADAT